MRTETYHLIRSAVRLVFGIVLIALAWFLLHWLASSLLLAAAGSVSLLVLYIIIVNQQNKNL